VGLRSKRILLSLSKLNNFAPNNAVLATLGLNPEEMELVLEDHEYSAKNCLESSALAILGGLPF
jgi:predicted glycosyltransferase